jgi:hypothetical protein
MQTDDGSDAAMTDAQRLAWLEAQAEGAYDKMYDASSSTDAAARYSDAKEAMNEAIGLARRLGQGAVAPGSRRGSPTSRRCSARSSAERRRHSLCGLRQKTTF